MSTKVVFYMVMAEIDQTEGRGGTKSTGIAFAHRADAEKYIRSPDYIHKYGLMQIQSGDPRFHIRDYDVAVFDSYDEFDPDHAKKARERALSKLTADDIAALGLTTTSPKDAAP